MRITLRAIVPLLVLTAAPVVAEAQRGFPGSVRDSPRPLVDEAGPPAGAQAVAGDGDGDAKTQRRWLLGTAGNTSGAGSGFSTMGGLNIKIPRLFTIEGTASYERAMPNDLDATDAFGATLELGTSRMVTGDTLELGLSVSGEMGWEGESARSYAAGVTASATFLSRLELGGNLAYAGSDPAIGGTEWELVPGVSASIFPMEELTVGITYTFENDLAVEDGYEVSAKYRVREFRNGGSVQLRLGVDSDERFKAGVVLKL
jgi:hypothetical protein